jgi:lysophospholipase L1-like esterase
MGMLSRRLVIAVLIVVGLAGNAMPAAAATIPLPNSMASAGDSITRAFDVGWCCFLKDSPQYSWSTGNNLSVNSQYRRLLALNAGIANHEYNDAQTGANMSALDGQVQQAAAAHVDYLTVLMGANDVCTSTIATMTPTATFQAEFHQALQDFFAADPGAHVFVSSLPNIYQLWSTLHTNPSAESAWNAFKICQSMLSTGNTEAQRQQVLAQEQADNNVLIAVCVQFTNCRSDNDATYNFKFPASDVSTVDYFHPDVAGQNALASVSWAAGYWAP